jgi:hypothetical protein
MKIYSPHSPSLLVLTISISPGRKSRRRHHNTCCYASCERQQRLHWCIQFYSPPPVSAGTRMMWYTSRRICIGYVPVVNGTFYGQYSFAAVMIQSQGYSGFASGVRYTCSGSCSFTAGYGAIASVVTVFCNRWRIARK